MTLDVSRPTAATAPAAAAATPIDGRVRRHLPLALLAALAAALLLVPDRYTVPIGGQFGLRPHQIVVVAAAAGVAVRFRRGAPLAVGRPAWIAGLLVVVGVASIAANGPRMAEADFVGAVRLTILYGFYALLAVVVAATATSPQRRRFLVASIVTVLAVSTLFAAREAATETPVRLDPPPPGLVEERDADLRPGEEPSTIVRNGEPRPAGLAANPLELSAVMALGLPLAAFLLVSSRSWRAQAWFAGCCLLIALGAALSISRTGLLAVGIALAIAAIANLSRPRLLVLGVVAVATLGLSVQALAPQPIDALFEQLTKDSSEDPSLATRAKDYAELDNLLGQRPWLGNGPDAISSYVGRDSTGVILDNQYLLSIADTGVIGLIALLAVLGSTAATATRRAREAPAERGLFVAVVCATAGFALMCATFDVLRFPQATSLFMILVGVVSAAVDERGDRSASAWPAEGTAWRATW